MVYRNPVQACLVFLGMVIICTLSIPIDRNESLNALQISESREHMMLNYRLPNNTIPRLYEICIEPNMDDENLTWIGKINIDIEVMEATTLLTLHAYKNLVIYENSTELIDMNGTKFKPTMHSRDEELEFFEVRFDPEIAVGNYSFHLAFEGENPDTIDGFFKASYNDQNETSIAGTHFEATSARWAFPCWDEPSLKAHFQMSIKHFPNYTAISNMPEIGKVVTQDGKILTTFDTTPIMSTYLLTFVIADFGNISNEYGNVTVWGRNDVLEMARNVLDLSPKVIEVMEKYTGLSFGFPRIGSVLLPRFPSAATEHWGLVTYMESLVRFNRTSGVIWEEDRIHLLIAHELAHSWFGNHVSPVWWDDLWLNEAFAAYFQYLIVDEIFDNWGGEELFIYRNNYRTSFGIDDAWAIPVKWTPVNNKDIRRLFKPITYRKGAAIVHMFHKVLTHDVFRSGIQKYLAKNSLGPVTADDLMQALQETYNESIYAEVPLNVKETMTSWLTQLGYPIVNVTRNYTTGITMVAQESALIRENITNKWWIPLTYATQSNHNFSSTVPSRWISDEEDSVTIDGISKDDWVIFNIQSSGYYRVIYDEENWNRIANYLNTDNYKNIPVLNRAQLLNDAIFMISVDPDRYYRIFYKLTKYMSRETDYLPWLVAQNAVLQIGESLAGTEVNDIFQRYTMGQMNALIKKVGFEKRDNDDHLTRLAREDLVLWACLSGNQECLEYAAEKLIQVVENGTNDRLNLDITASIYCAGLRGLNDTKAKEVVAWAFENKKKLVIRYLGCTENHDIHREYFIGNKTAHFMNNARSMSRMLGYIMERSEENFNFAIDFFLENHQAMNNVESPKERVDSLMYAVTKIADQVKTAARLEKFKKLLQLDAVMKAEEIDEAALLDIVKTNVAESNERVAKFRNIWDEQFSPSNMIIDSHPQPH